MIHDDVQVVHDIEYGYSDPLRCKVRRCKDEPRQICQYIPCLQSLSCCPGQFQDFVQEANLLELQGHLANAQVSPEFSIRLLDETYQEENDTIQQIQDHMVEYFRGREGALAKDGITGAISAMSHVIVSCQMLSSALPSKDASTSRSTAHAVAELLQA